MTKQQSDVKEFMQKFGRKCPDKPTMPDLQTRILRCRLILEEAVEFCNACGLRVALSELQDIQSNNSTFSLLKCAALEPDLTAYADATADLRFVVEGADVAAGIDGEPIFDAVHRSNMSKAWTPDECLTLPKNEGIHVTAIDQHEPDMGFVVKNASGKVLKSPSYLEAIPMIADELERQAK